MASPPYSSDYQNTDFMDSTMFDEATIPQPIGSSGLLPHHAMSGTESFFRSAPPSASGLLAGEEGSPMAIMRAGENAQNYRYDYMRSRSSAPSANVPGSSGPPVLTPSTPVWPTYANPLSTGTEVGSSDAGSQAYASLLFGQPNMASLWANQMSPSMPTGPTLEGETLLYSVVLGHFFPVFNHNELYGYSSLKDCESNLA